MNCSLYWRNPLGTLCNMGVADVESVKDAQQLVLEHLHETNEIFLKPLLCLIKGGKPT